MNDRFDLAPTEPLRGAHLCGTVDRRFLISHPVPPEALERFLPPGAELSLHRGRAWVSACFVHMEDMRPSFAPPGFGLAYSYLIHRTRARLPFPDGELREGVLVLEPNLNRRLLAAAGRGLTGIRFHRRDIELAESDDAWTLRMTLQGRVMYEATLSKTLEGPALPPGSRFGSVREAERFLLGVSHGGQWSPATSTLRLLPETHEPRETLATRCETRTNVFLDELGCGEAPADHALSMTNVAHWFGLLPRRVRLGARLEQVVPEPA